MSESPHAPSESARGAAVPTPPAAAAAGRAALPACTDLSCCLAAQCAWWRERALPCVGATIPLAQAQIRAKRFERGHCKVISSDYQVGYSCPELTWDDPVRTRVEHGVLGAWPRSAI